MPGKTKSKGEASSPQAPRQKRSARTQDRLLGAALQVLGRDGVDTATVPRIAEAAKLSPGSIYRRFADKDDLLRAALLAMLQARSQSAAAVQTQLAKSSFADTCAGVVAALLRQYREHPHLFRALGRMLELDPESAFAREAALRVSEVLKHYATALLQHRESIRHPDPERAVRFAVISAISTVENIALERVSLWKMALPLNDKAIVAELTRETLGYLRRKP